MAPKKRPIATAPTSRGVTLRGAHAVDPALADEAVRVISRVVGQAGLAASVAIAQGVLTVFGASSAAEFLAHEREHKTWNAVALRVEELNVSPVYLRRCIEILAQLDRLPPEIGQALSPSHHEKLLALDSDEMRLALARQAKDEGLTVQQLGALVADAKSDAGQAPRGRPNLPEFVKQLNAIHRTVPKIDLGSIHSGAVGQWGRGRANQALVDLTAQIEALEGVRDRLEEAIEGADDDDD